MSHRSLMIKVPSCPFSLDVLRPNRRLAQFAACLNASGHETTILDYGTIEMLERLYPLSLRATAPSLVDELHVEESAPSFDTLLAQWELQGHPEALLKHHQQVWQECALEIAEDKALDVVVFCVDSLEEQRIVESMITVLRAHCPRLSIIGMGSQFIQHPEQLPHAVEPYDCVYWGNMATPFVDMVDTLDRREDWPTLPFIAFHDDVRFTMTHQESCLRETPLPDYSAATYPALHEARKLLFFEIEDCPVQGIPCTERTLSEIQLLQSLFDAQAFQFTGSDAQHLHAESLARTLLDRHINIRYTRECHVQSTPNSTVPLLPASGCYSVDFQIDTGSQRLLDRYYHHPFTVTQVEQTLRACKFSNLHTVMNFSYPSVEDDYHTFMETLRLAERCKPNSVVVGIPAQVHKPLSDLKTRFEVEPTYRASAEIQDEHTALLQAFQERGIPSHITPPLALMAHLAGYRGLEEEFMHQLMYQLMSGDALGLNVLLKQLNRSICKVPNTVTFTPFTPLQQVVGN